MKVNATTFLYRERSNMISRHEGGVGNCQKKRDNHYIKSLNKKRDNGGGKFSKKV